MPALSFATAHYVRSDGLPEARLVNAYVEAPNKRAVRPGLKLAYTVGVGPVTLFQQSGVFGSDVLAASGANLYRGASLVGSIGTSGPVRMAVSDTQLVIINRLDATAYCYDGALVRITDPDLPPVSDVAYLAGRFYYNQQNSDRWYFSALGDATSIDGLAFATAEEAPDPTMGMATLRDELWFFGRTTVEPWSQTSDANNPLQRGLGRTFNRGCISADTVQPLDNSIFWVGNDLIVYRVEAVPTRISTNGVESRLVRCSDPSGCSALSFYHNGHAFYVLSIPGQGTYAYDVSSGQWSEFTTIGEGVWRPNGAVMVDGVPYLGDRGTGKVFTLDADTYQDDGLAMERVISARVDLIGAPQRCDVIRLNCAVGSGDPGQAEPVVEMRYSDDRSRTWSDWEDASLGSTGDYLVRPEWRRLGLMRAPGRDFEFRCTDAVSGVYQDASINEPY